MATQKSKKIDCLTGDLKNRKTCELFEEFLSTINSVYKRTHWCAEQNVESLCAFLMNELSELESAVKHRDNIGIAGELADLLILFSLAVFVLEEEGSLDFPRVIQKARDKLRHRYPGLFGPKNSGQLLFPFYQELTAEREEAIWRAQKINEKRLEVSFCINKKCPEYLIAGSPWLTIRVNKGKKMLRCDRCRKVVRLSSASLFFTEKTDPERILQVLADFIRTRKGTPLSNIAFKNSVSVSTLQRWLKKATINLEVIAQILSKRYNLESQNVLEAISKSDRT